MPKFRVTVEKWKPAAAEYWTNVYHCNVADIAAALDFGAAVVIAERPLYKGGITITKIRADDATPLTEVSGTIVYNLTGTRNTTGSDDLPLFVVARVDFSTVGGGRPSRKYLRGVFEENDVSFSTISSGVLSELQTYAAAVVAAAGADVDNQLFSSGTVLPAPAMRQLRRGSKKKLVP